MMCTQWCSDVVAYVQRMLDELILWRCGVKKGQDLDVLMRMQTKPMWRTFMTEKCRSQTTSIPVVGTRSEEA